MTLGPKPPSSTCRTRAERSRRRRRDTPLHRVASTRSPRWLSIESNASEHGRPNNAATLRVEEQEGLVFSQAMVLLLGSEEFLELCLGLEVQYMLICLNFSQLLFVI